MYWLYIKLKQFSQQSVSQNPDPVEEKKKNYCKELSVSNKSLRYPYVLCGILIPYYIILGFMEKKG